MSAKTYGDIYAGTNSRVHAGDKHYYGQQERLKCVEAAEFDSWTQVHSPCHPDTRKVLLQDIKAWAGQPDAKSIFWLNGVAGTGKSTIAYTIAQWLSSQGPNTAATLGASFFFKRGEADQSSAALFFPTIADQLSRTIPGLKTPVKQALLTNPSICSKALGQQFDELIRRPLQALDTSQNHPTYVVVVDALDECQDGDDVEVLLQLWSGLATSCIVPIRLFLTSRPELPIRISFADISAHYYRNLILHELPRPIIEQDIQVYLRDEMASIRKRYNRCCPRSAPLTNDWPGDEVLNRFTMIAIPLFIMATTLCRYIHDKKAPARYDPRKRLSTVLTAPGPRLLMKIGQVYYPILAQILPSDDELSNSELIEEEAQVCEQFRLVVGTIITLVEPLSVDTLAVLLDVEIHYIESCISQLHSVLQIPNEADLPVRPLHLSFGEYLCSEDLEDKRFHVSSDLTHRNLLSRCLEVLSSSGGLREDICNFDQPGRLRLEVPTGRIHHYISPAVRYACHYWVNHCQQSQTKIGDGDQVHRFLRVHFLRWLEAMSLLDNLAKTMEHVRTLQSLVLSDGAVSVTAMLRDAERFILAHRYIIDKAPLQVYSSAIIFSPQNSVVRQVCGQVPTYVQLCPMTPLTWGAEIQKLQGHDGGVTSVAFSPDGLLLAFAAWDRTVRVWRVSTNEEAWKLVGHIDFIVSLAFSPDGSLLASASHDRTVRLWRVSTGEELWKLEGHEEGVISVSFLSGGTLIASASADGVLRIWRVNTGEEIQRLEPTGTRLTAVAFSPDETLIALTSSHKPLSLRRVGTYEEIRKLEIYGGWNFIPVFSPDGSFLSSGSPDNTLRVWQASTGEMVQKLDGHTDNIHAVAFSPDGMLLASASQDGTIRLWKVAANEGIPNRTEYDNSVSTMVCSPDGTLLASGSIYKTIRVWQVSTGDELKKLEGHRDRINTVAFSSDGSLLVSASQDRTVRIWRISTSEVKRIYRHPYPVDLVALSQDGSLLACTTHDNDLYLWPISIGEVHRVEKRTKPIMKLKFRTDTIEARGIGIEEVFESIKKLKFSPDGSLLAYVFDSCEIHVLRTNTGELRKLEGHTDIVNEMNFSPDGSMLASASNDTTVRVWQLSSGEMIQKLQEHAWRVESVAFSLDGALLASALEDKTMRVWRVGTGEEVQRFYVSRVVTEVSFTSDSTALVTDRGRILLNTAASTPESNTDLTYNFDSPRDWIRYRDQRLLWLPTEYRGYLHFWRRNTLVIGSESGAVSFIRLQDP